MAKDLLGVEIGNSRVKLAEMKGGKFKRFVSFDIPENTVHNDEIVTWEALSTFIRDGLKENGVSTRNAALVIPDSGAYIRRMRLPVMTEKQLLVNLPYEFKDLLTEDKDSYLYDYSMIEIHRDGEGKPVEMELLGAAVSKKLMERYQDMFRQAGLRLIKASPRDICLSAVVRSLSEDKQKGDFAILDLGFNSTRVDIFRNGVYEITREIDIGTESVVRIVADLMNCDPHIARSYVQTNKDNILDNERCVEVYQNIGVEVMRAMNYYSFENPDNTLESLYYCGGGATMERYIAEIAATVPLKLEPLSALMPEQQDALMNGAAALGSCLE